MARSPSARTRNCNESATGVARMRSAHAWVRRCAHRHVRSRRGQRRRMDAHRCVAAVRRSAAPHAGLGRELADLVDGGGRDHELGNFTPQATINSHGPSKPWGPSKRASSVLISCLASSRWAAARPPSIWCSAPKDSRSGGAGRRGSDRPRPGHAVEARPAGRGGFWAYLGCTRTTPCEGAGQRCE